LFPLAIVFAGGLASLVAAFVIGGLREISEPLRKAMIVDFAEPHLRARTVGLYYLARGLAVAPAAAVGGLFWKSELIIRLSGVDEVLLGRLSLPHLI
jgi:hypothetical protein